MAKKWYAVHTYSGFENKVKKSLEERVRQFHLEEKVDEILIPMEQVVEMVYGEKKTSKRKFFPGYILVHMEMGDETWHLVKDTAKVTGFVGANKPPVSEAGDKSRRQAWEYVPVVKDNEVARLTSQISEGTSRPKPKVQFEDGDQVRVIDGPFQNFNGTVEEVKPEKGKLRVLVSIFGRATPVELDFMQVEKT